MLANLVCSLIKHKRVTTTLAKAKAARSVAEKMVTLGKNGTIHDRRLAVARLHQEDVVKILFVENHAVFAANVVREFLSRHAVTVVPSIAAVRQARAAAHRTR